MTGPTTPDEPGQELPSRIRVEVVRDVRRLEALAPSWEALAADAIDSNVFYEPWLLLPALRHLDANRTILFVFLFATNPRHPAGPPVLCAMFPFEHRARYRGLPCGVLSLARPTYNRLCTPLVHKDFVIESVHALLNWLEASPEGQPLVEFRFITGDGRVAQELHQQVEDRRWEAYQSECTIRALLKPMASAEAYLGRALSGKHRKELRRLERRLHDLGPTEFRALNPQDDAREWIVAFLELESRGWKGRANTSLDSREQTRDYFREAAEEAHRHGQLMMLGLFHQGKPLALKCNFVSGPGAFAFKIAYDEAFERFSPGVLLELENVRRVHGMPQIAWMDSTADAVHFMINRLWLDRRTVETLLVSPGDAWGNCMVAIFPLLRACKAATRRFLRGGSPERTAVIRTPL